MKRINKYVFILAVFILAYASFIQIKYLRLSGRHRQLERSSLELEKWATVSLSFIFGLYDKGLETIGELYNTGEIRDNVILEGYLASFWHSLGYNISEIKFESQMKHDIPNEILYSTLDIFLFAAMQADGHLIDFYQTRGLDLQKHDSISSMPKTNMDNIKINIDKLFDDPKYECRARLSLSRYLNSIGNFTASNEIYKSLYNDLNEEILSYMDNSHKMKLYLVNNDWKAAIQLREKVIPEVRGKVKYSWEEYALIYGEIRAYIESGNVDYAKSIANKYIEDGVFDPNAYKMLKIYLEEKLKEPIRENLDR